MGVQEEGECAGSCLGRKGRGSLARKGGSSGKTGPDGGKKKETGRAAQIRDERATIRGKDARVGSREESAQNPPPALYEKGARDMAELGGIESGYGL